MRKKGAVVFKLAYLALNPVQHGGDDHVLFRLVVGLVIKTIPAFVGHLTAQALCKFCLLYTSDAADE